MKKKRDYKEEYRDYHGTSMQKKDRAGRNTARAAAMSSGRVSKGDGKHIDHKDNNPRNNSSSNTRVMSARGNLNRPRRKIG
jgi:hypothetical protein